MVVILQCIIKVVKVFSYNQNFVLRELSDLAPGLHVHLWNCLTNFHQISHGAFCLRDIDKLFKWFCTIEQDGHV